MIIELCIHKEEDWIVRHLLVNDLIPFDVETAEFYKRLCRVALDRGIELKFGGFTR